MSPPPIGNLPRHDRLLATLALHKSILAGDLGMTELATMVATQARAVLFLVAWVLAVAAR